MAERELATEKAAMMQQPVISIRISEALRLKLEGLKVLMSMKSGEPVSTSEAAKQLLESSKEERLELVSLLTEPTDSLLMIRRKADSKLPLSQAEWTTVAYFCLHGVERFANTAQTEISYESLAGILEAFQAVYGLLRKPNKTRNYGSCLVCEANRKPPGMPQGFRQEIHMKSPSVRCWQISPLRADRNRQRRSILLAKAGALSLPFGESLAENRSAR